MVQGGGKGDSIQEGEAVVGMEEVVAILVGSDGLVGSGYCDSAGPGTGCLSCSEPYHYMTRGLGEHVVAISD